MAEPGNVAAVEKKKRKRTKKNKKSASKQIVSVIVDDGDRTDSDEDENDIFNYLKMSPSSAQAQMHQSSSELAAQELHAYEGNHMEDPVSKTIGLVTQLSNGSYSLDRVTNCVHRMWDTGLQYDSVDAVLKELAKEDDERSEQASETKSIHQEQHSPPQSRLESLPSTTSSSSMQINTAPLPPAREDSPVTTTSSSSSSPKCPAPTTQAPASTPAPVTEYSLSARLELAASHPDISEALVALETWCRMVGPMVASKEFFECQALEILLQSLLSNPSLIQQKQVKSILTSLFMHVFPAPSSAVAPASGSTVNASIFVESLEKFCEKLSQLQVLHISSDKSGTSSSSPLASRVSESLRAVHAIFMKEQNLMQDKGSQYALEADIFARRKQMHQLHQKLTGNGQGASADIVQVESSGSNIRDILELSDVTQDLLNLQLEKHANESSAAAVARKESSSAPFSSNTKALVVPTITGSHAADKQLETHVLAASGASRMEIDNLKAQAASISTYYDRLTSENDSILAPYHRDFIKCNETLSNLQQNYQYMQLQLKNIENEMNMVKNQAASIQNDISKIKLQQEARMNDLTTSHTDVVRAIETDKELQFVLANVHLLENALQESTHAMWGEHASPSPTLAGAQSETPDSSDLEAVFEEYVLAEMKCTEFLCKRHTLMVEKMSHLEREIVEYTNLGMKNLAADIRKSIEVLKENRQEDVDALVGVQETLYTNMLHMKNAADVVISQQTMQYLHQIATSLSNTGVSLHPDIASYVNYQQQKQPKQKPAQQKQPQQKQSQQKQPQQKQQAPIASPATATTSTDSSAAPLPPRQKRGGAKKDSTPPPSPPPSSATKARGVTPPPGLRLPTPPPTPPTSTTSASSATAAAPTSSWGGWGAIPKITEPFKISK